MLSFYWSFGFLTISQVNIRIYVFPFNMMQRTRSKVSEYQKNILGTIFWIIVKRPIFLISCIIQTWWQTRRHIYSLEYSHFNTAMWDYSCFENGKWEFQLYRESLFSVFLDPHPSHLCQMPFQADFSPFMWARDQQEYKIILCFFILIIVKNKTEKDLAVAVWFN